MLLNQRKRKRTTMKEINETKEDRISQLPDCLLHHIFSFSDTAHVVKTCILSKRWRYLWTSSPNLNFNSTTFSRVTTSEEKSFFNFVNQVLLRRNYTPINNFFYNSLNFVEAGAVESWIYYAVKHQVQHLIIEAYCPNLPPRFPHCFFGCTSLTTLKLVTCDYESMTLPRTLDLPSLKNLHLVRFKDFDGSIFSSCPNLETLKLEKLWMDRIRKFSVCAQNLKSLDILSMAELMFYPNCEFIIMAPKLVDIKFVGHPPLLYSTKNICSLDQIDVDLPSHELLDRLYRTDEQKQKFALDVLQMLNAFHIAKTITLSANVIQVLSYIRCSLNEHPLPFPNLKFLKLKSSESSKNVKIPTFILNYFLKSSPLLEICW
ncbi:F-box/FBD/LRR-repeat protein At5g56420-like [Mercurialis annua]|uniref:F-box/FBD/LRR-repeat protein At5g56420-like n=1 Tax=Mercurialis annua TaxID=3986 RepID=UPI00215E5860|nr:F-box/FBD/LRR-repeat protein At5g56420-like [Mercurialis annua]XP_050231933.1 F-box/FBD/LRR-repeat protein At5g56420-like [Mercurialis annua]